VLDCACRTLTRQAGVGCDYPLETCLIISEDEGAFDGSELIRAIDLAEALQILREAESMGLVHTTGNIVARHPIVCNCCPCCCPMLRGVTEFARPTAVAHSDFCVSVDESVCDGCGECLERCHFSALSLVHGVCAVDRTRCPGCGLCVLACPTEALSLERRPAGETPARPADFDAWMAQHADARGISLAEMQ
jgi:ferredoxin